MNIVILDGYTTNPGDVSWDAIARQGTLTVYDRTAPEELLPRLRDAEVVYTNKVPLRRATLDACPGLRFISTLSTGVNVINLEAAREKGIPVSNIPSYSTDAVAQHTFALLLEIANQVGHHSAAVRGGKWQACDDFTFQETPIIELLGKTMGIIGFGSIGRRTAQIATAMGMRVVAHSRSETETGRALASYLPLEELLAVSDVVSLHCPLTPETEGIIRKESIAMMKDGAILLNTARGPLVNEQDVADALRSGKLYAMGSDVAAVEPILADNPLLDAPRCWMTPHIAWAPTATRVRLIDIAAENLRAFLAGSPVNVVNP